MSDTMQAVVCRKPHDIAVERLPLARAAPGDVLLRVRRVGLCGTDYHIYAGLHPFLEYPRLIGHEISAEVEEAPAGSGWSRGQLVVVNPYLACGHCPACLADKANCCRTLAVLGVHCEGGMSEYLAMPPGNLVPADGLDADQAASVEYLAIGAHAVRRAAARPGARALVIGAGPIGIGAALFARIAGAQVTLVDRDPDRLALVAAATGSADHLLADDGLAQAVAQGTGGNGFDVVFDATGNRASMEASFGHVAHGGVLVFVGVVKSPVTFDDPELHRRELTLMASRNATMQDFAQVMGALRDGRIDVSRLITHRTTLARIVHDLPLWTGQKTGLIKAMLDIG